MDSSNVQRELDDLLHRFAGRLDLDIPPAVDRGGDAALALRGWSEGVEAERLRALSLLRQLRELADGPIAHLRAAVHYAVTTALDSADRWREYYRSAGEAPGRFALLARAEVASRLASALREVRDGSLLGEAAA